MEIEVGRERPLGRLPERDREPYVRAETVADPLRRLRAAEIVRADLADHHMLRSYVAELLLVPVRAPVVVPAEEIQVLRVGQVRLRVLDENLVQPGGPGFPRPDVQEVRQRGGHDDVTWHGAPPRGCGTFSRPLTDQASRKAAGCRGIATFRPPALRTPPPPPPPTPRRRCPAAPWLPAARRRSRSWSARWRSKSRARTDAAAS